MAPLLFCAAAPIATAAEFRSAPLSQPEEARRRRVVELFPDRLDTDIPRAYAAFPKAGCRLARHQPANTHGREALWEQRCNSSWICENASADSAIDALRAELPVTGDGGDESLDRDVARLDDLRASSLEAAAILEGEMKLLANAKASCAVAATERAAHLLAIRRSEEALRQTRVDLSIRLHRPSEEETSQAERLCQHEHYKIRTSSRATGRPDTITACGQTWPTEYWSRQSSPESGCEGRVNQRGYILMTDSPVEMLHGLAKRMSAIAGVEFTSHCVSPATDRLPSICRETLRKNSFAVPHDSLAAADAALRSVEGLKRVELQALSAKGVDRIVALRGERSRLASLDAPWTSALVDKILSEKARDEGFAWLQVSACSSAPAPSPAPAVMTPPQAPVIPDIMTPKPGDSTKR